MTICVSLFTLPVQMVDFLCYLCTKIGKGTHYFLEGAIVMMKAVPFTMTRRGATLHTMELRAEDEPILFAAINRSSALGSICLSPGSPAADACCCCCLDKWCCCCCCCWPRLARAPAGIPCCTCSVKAALLSTDSPATSSSTSFQDVPGKLLSCQMNVDI